MNTLFAWEMLCCVLLWSVFVRLVHVDTTTKTEVRMVLVAAGLASLVGIGAPLYGWLPDGLTLLMFATVVSMETILASPWKSGIPAQFIKDMHRPKRRAGDAAP